MPALQGRYVTHVSFMVHKDTASNRLPWPIKEFFGHMWELSGDSTIIPCGTGGLPSD